MRQISRRRRKLAAAVASTAMLLPLVAAHPAIAGAPPVAFFSPSTPTGRSVALSEAGASVISRTDSLGGCWEPYYLLDLANDCGWHTNYGSIANQSVVFSLAGGDVYVIDRIKLTPYYYQPWRVKDFSVAVSTTTTDPSAFTTVLTGTAADNNSLQTFTLPVPAFARYVRFTIVNIRGGTCCYAAMENLKVFSGQGGGATVTFTNLSSDPENDIVSYAWNFGDGSPIDTSPNPVHTFPGPGEYQVALTVTDATGASDTQTLIQRVSSPPTGTVTVTPASPNEGSYPTFSVPGADPDGGSVLWRTWTWGDGSGGEAGAAPSRTHYVRDNATYNGTVTLIDDEEESATIAFTYTGRNLPPSANVYGDRTIVSGQRLYVGTAVSDPTYYDTLTCRWDHGDGTTADPGSCYALDRRYTLPAGSSGATYTATLTVTDDDGASASDSLDVKVLPQIFRGLGNSNLPGLYAVGWSPLVNRTLVAWSQTCSTRLSLLGADGQLQHVGGNLQRSYCNETDMAISDGRDGFGAGDVFLGNGRPGEIVRVRMDANGTHLGTDNPWVTLPGVPCCQPMAGATFDTAGTFGGDLITVWGDGQVFRTSAAGVSTRVAHLNRPLSGADVAPASGFGPASGCVLTTDYYYGNVWSVCASGATAVVRAPGASHWLESLTVVRSAGELLVTDPDQGTVLRAGASAIPSALAGHVLVATTYNGELWDVSWDPATSSYTSKLFTLAMRSDALVHIEHTAFVPALLSGTTTLTPADASVAVGSAHAVTATVRDSAGAPVPGVELTFTVTGANPGSGTATTDANGEGTFTYTGANTGVDTIVAGTLGASSAPATATWVLRATELEVDPVVLRADDDETEVAGELRARLTDDTGAPVAGREVAFSVEDASTGEVQEVCRAVTDGDGVATCADRGAVIAPMARGGVRAQFGGDDAFAASSGTAPVMLVDRDLP